MKAREYFTEAEARALVGRKVRTTIRFIDVLAGTTATVTRADPNAADEGWTVAVTWDLPHTSRQLTDWFNRNEYTRWFVEIAEGAGA